MRPLFKVANPNEGFLLGFEYTDGIMINEITEEEAPIKMLNIGFFLFEISLIW